jgi:pimeloyl-ACP methyl ester carboxylesterase
MAPTPEVIQEQIAGPTGSLHVDDGGTGGLPVVFVHSFSGSTAHWSKQLAHLRSERRTVALDLRGHGQSESPAGNDYAVESLAGDVAAVVDELGLKRFVLVGHSMGGSAAIAYAGAHPERVAGLFLVGTPGKTPANEADKIMTAMKADYEKVTEGYWNQLLEGAQLEVLKQVRRDMAKIPQDAAVAMIQAVFEFDPLPALRAYKGPKMVVNTPHGDTPNALHRQLPDLPYKQIAGTSHWLQMDKPDELNRILDGFLAAPELR